MQQQQGPASSYFTAAVLQADFIREASCGPYAESMSCLQVQHGDATGSGAGHLPCHSAVVLDTAAGAPLAAVCVPAAGNEPHKSHAL